MGWTRRGGDEVASFTLIPSEVVIEILKFLPNQCLFPLFTVSKGFFPLCFTALNKNINGRNNYPIIWACKNGYLSCVKLILKDWKADPSVKQNAAIVAAAEKGHPEIVKLLLNDSRIDPRVENGGLKWACVAGHVDVVRVLLDDKRINPTAENNSAIVWTCQNARNERHLQIVRMLIESGADYTARDYVAIREACRRGFHLIVKYLMQNYNMDPAETNCLLHACSSEEQFEGGDKLELIRFLLSDGRVDPNPCFVPACRTRSIPIVRLLMLDKRLTESAMEEGRAIASQEILQLLDGNDEITTQPKATRKCSIL